MPTSAFLATPCYLKFHGHDNDHKYKSLAPFLSSYQAVYIKNSYKLNGKHRSHQLCKLKRTDRTATKASNNSQSETQASETQPSWLKWVGGIIFSVILPAYFTRNKWASFLSLKSKVDETLDKVEAVVETVEDVAEGVEKLADEISDKLPDDSKLKETLEYVESKAQEAVKGAKQVEELLEKVEEAEEMFEGKLESKLQEKNNNQAKSDETKQS